MEQPTDRRLGLSRVAPSQPPNPSPLGGYTALVSPRRPGFSLGLPFPFRSVYRWGMLRTLLDEIVGRLRQFGSHADGLEDENRRLQAELADLLAARRENDDTRSRSDSGTRPARRWST
jgi:hypothetical protein